MKLRNKKTGEIVDLSEGFIKDTYSGEFIQIKPVAISNKEGYLYGSLADLIADWEDYKPKEPLIKDENIRKIIRAWADENNTTVVEYKLFKNEFVDGYFNIIGFNREFNELCGKSYTIDELCGEEEE